MDRRCWLAKSARLVATAIFGGPAWRKGCQLPRRENRPILFGEYFFGSCMTRRRRFQRGRPLRVAHWRPRGARFPRINARAWHIMLPQRWIGLKRGGAEASLFRRRAPRSPPTVQPSAAFTASSSPDARFAAAKLDPLTDRAPWPRQIHRRPGRPPRPVLLRARSSSHDPDFPAPPPNERVASRSFQDPECRPSARRDTSSAASRPRRGPLGEGRQPPDRSLSKTRHVKVSFQGRSPGRGAERSTTGISWPRIRMAWRSLFRRALPRGPTLVGAEARVRLDSFPNIASTQLASERVDVQGQGRRVD
jgi:hypothetical protein